MMDSGEEFANGPSSLHMPPAGASAIEGTCTEETRKVATVSVVPLWTTDNWEKLHDWFETYGKQTYGIYLPKRHSVCGNCHLI